MSLEVSYEHIVMCVGQVRDQLVGRLARLVNDENNPPALRLKIKPIWRQVHEIHFKHYTTERQNELRKYAKADPENPMLILTDREDNAIFKEPASVNAHAFTEANKELLKVKVPILGEKLNYPQDFEGRKEGSTPVEFLFSAQDEIILGWLINFGDEAISDDEIARMEAEFYGAKAQATAPAREPEAPAEEPKDAPREEPEPVNGSVAASA